MKDAILAMSGIHAKAMARSPRSKLASHAVWNEPHTFSDPFCAAVREWIAAIPPGRVATYGQIAHLAGKPWGARQVAWILHSQSGKYELPWQRVIGAAGRISLPPGKGFAEQRRLLRTEGVVVDGRGRVDLEKYRWQAVGEFPVK
jgi:methylated-DNA-protein-cysteine methyltransferase-like protein